MVWGPIQGLEVHCLRPCCAKVLLATSNKILKYFRVFRCPGDRGLELPVSIGLLLKLFKSDSGEIFSYRFLQSLGR